MPNYVVEAVEQVKTVPGNNNRPSVNVLKLTLSNGTQSGVAELFDNTNLNPQVGQQLEGTVEPSEYGLKFRPVRRGGGGRAPRSPEENARTMRQHSQEMALRLLALQGKSGATAEDVKVLADWFDSDAKAATP